jgi:citrate synthase
VIAGETALSHIDGDAGRLLYRGYPIGELVKAGSYAAVAELLWTGEWNPAATLPCAPVPDAVMTALRALPASARPMDALRTAVSAWGAVANPGWPATADEARALTAFSPSALAAFARLRQGLDPVDPDPELDLVPGYLYQVNGERPDAETARALDAYFIVGAEHGFNASTFTCRVITSTRADLASAVCGAIGAMKGPLHGGAPSEVVEQIHEVGTPEHAEEWVRTAISQGIRLMGFGHRVYRAYDPRAAALREVAESMERRPDWLQLAIAVEDVALRVLAEKHPDRALKTNVEYYAAPVLMGVGLTPDLFPATFALARHAGWTAHAIEQGANNRLIRPDVRYVGEGERRLPG